MTEVQLRAKKMIRYKLFELVYQNRHKLVKISYTLIIENVTKLFFLVI